MRIWIKRVGAIFLWLLDSLHSGFRECLPSCPGSAFALERAETGIQKIGRESRSVRVTSR